MESINTREVTFELGSNRDCLFDRFDQQSIDDIMNNER
jgi:hypothetical protein